MMCAQRAFVLAAMLAVVSMGCGSSDDGVGSFADARPGIDGGPMVDGGSEVADALTPPDGPSDIDGPSVRVVSPTEPAAGDFSSGAIITSDRFTVECEAAPNPATGVAVDATSVEVTVYGVNDAVSAMAQPTSVANRYVASIVAPTVENGPLTVRCTAADTAAEPKASSDEIRTFLDLGPRVDIFVPIASASYAHQVGVVFTVTGWPVAAGDTGAAPDADAVELIVSGEPVPVTRSGTSYQATVTFDDPRFDPSLEGANTVTVRAPNTRTGGAVTRARTVVFNADSDGPLIDVVAPVPGELVSGIIDVIVEVSDPAGVSASSVIGTIAGSESFSLAPAGGNQYLGSFDTRALGKTMVYPTIVVRAQDAVGNQSSYGFLVGLDNVPPVVSLDPPLVREAEVKEGVLECSLLFDPVGADATDDGESVAQLSELRVRIHDRGNSATDSSGVAVPVALIEDDAVQLHILDDADGALIVDTDGDGVCDDINPLLVPTSVPMAANETAVIDLTPLPSSGSSWFTPDLDGYDGVFAGCSPPDPSTAPDALCVTTPASRIIKTVIGGLPQIYSIPPEGGDLTCMGTGFDAVATNIADGWACVAVRAPDRLGNVGVSFPLRVCVDADGDQAECPPWNTITTDGLPDCTGVYDPMTDTTDATASCTWPVRFADDDGWQLIRRDL